MKPPATYPISWEQAERELDKFIASSKLAGILYWFYRHRHPMPSSDLGPLALRLQGGTFPDEAYKLGDFYYAGLAISELRAEERERNLSLSVRSRQFLAWMLSGKIQLKTKLTAIKKRVGNSFLALMGLLPQEVVKTEYRTVRDTKREDFLLERLQTEVGLKDKLEKRLQELEAAKAKKKSR